MNKNILELIEYPEEGILSKEIVKGKMNVTLFCMAKGTEMTEHTSTKQGTIYVVEGDGVFKLSGKDIQMKPGVIIYMKENEVHSIKSHENTSFILTLI
jgi:nitric oxide dioxygenase